MIVLGINAYHPDAAAALMKDGVLLWAAEEERFNRVKHSSGFPALALRQCLTDTGIPPNAIDAVALSKNPRANFFKKFLFVLKHKPERELVWDRLKALRASSQFERDFFEALRVSPAFMKAGFAHVEHHQAHIASSFFVSGFDRAAFLSLDGLGDFSSAMWGTGRGTELRVMDRVFFPHSAGFLYTAATQFLGFPHFGDEFKVMGLAAYGKPVYLEPFRHLYRLRPNGRFELNLRYFRHQEGRAKIRWEGGAPEQDVLYSPAWEELFGIPRPVEEPLTERDQNIAASLQAALEEIFFHVLKNLYSKTKEKNLCLAGGVAFNSVANGKIKSKLPFENIYIQPAAGDAGTALGAAAFVAYSIHREPRTFVMNRADFGSSATDAEIESAIRAKGLHAVKLEEDLMIAKTVDSLERGGVVGWFQGRMEFGPRALGKRSILADPRRRDMKDILNRRIKRRESFRPFAPAVPEEDAAQYFEMDCAVSPFMLKVFPVKEEKKSVIPAVTHADGTARVQTVSREADPRFWKLLKAFGRKTGVPVLLNTSFNENEPIVAAPEEAVDCFLKTKMDTLVLGNYWLEKRPVSNDW